MKHCSSIASICIIASSLSSCNFNSNVDNHTVSRPHDNYSEQEVSNLKRKLQKTKFPQKDGFVKSLLKEGSYLRMRSASFTLPDKDGKIPRDPLSAKLNNEFTLIVYKDSYPNGNSPLSTDTVVTGAKIIQNQL